MEKGLKARATDGDARGGRQKRPACCLTPACRPSPPFPQLSHTCPPALAPNHTQSSGSVRCESGGASTTHMRSISGRSILGLGRVRRRAALDPGSIFGRSGDDEGPLQCRSGALLGSLLGRSGVDLEPVRCRLGRIWGVWGSIKGRSGVDPGKIQGAFPGRARVDPRSTPDRPCIDPVPARTLTDPGSVRITQSHSSSGILRIVPMRAQDDLTPESGCQSQPNSSASPLRKTGGPRRHQSAMRDVFPSFSAFWPHHNDDR